jgi:hypothetical protein
VTLPEEFDYLLYVGHDSNRDLADMDPARAAQHYVEYGKREGRICSAIDSRNAFLSLIPTDIELLEIGPYFNPSFRANTHRVSYLDVCSTAELKVNAATVPGADPDNVPEIDFVWQGQPYYRNLTERTFGVAYSSHSIEHQPCLVQHLLQVSSVLSKCGRYFLAIPDKRYCFDHYIRESTIADVLDAFIVTRCRHTAKSVIEHRFLVTHNDPSRHWAGDHGGVQSLSDKQQFERLVSTVHELRTSSSYVDPHAWKFTPDSFREIVDVLFEMKAISFKIERVYPTLRNSNEFYAVLVMAP